MVTRVGLLGLGEAAGSIWVPALNKASGVELVGGADPDPGAVGRMARLDPRVPVHEDLDQLLEAHRSIDWVVIATPPATHAALAVQALEAGKHVLVEKPFAPSRAEADRVLAAAVAADRHLAVNHEMTWMPMLSEPLARIARSQHGRLRFAQVWQTVSTQGGAAWRADGRTMAEFGTHAVDLLMAAFDETPEAVLAAMPRPDGATGDPVDLVTLFFSGGRAGHIVLDRLCQGVHRYLECRFDCNSASLRSSMGGKASVSLGLDPRTRRPSVQLDVARGGQAWVEVGSERTVIARNPTSALADATRRHLEALLGDVAAGREPRTSGRRARAVVSVVEAAYRSAEQGRRVAVEP